METVEIGAVGMSSDECERAIRNQFWRLSGDMVIRFNLTGGTAASDYPPVDFKHIRAHMPPVLECQFAIKAGKRWYLR